MNKKLVIIALAMMAVLMLAGCKKGESTTSLLQDISEDGKTCTVEANNAGDKDCTVSGSMIVEEGQKINVVSDIEGDGTITLEFCTNETLDALGEDASAEEIENAANSYTTVLSVEAGGSDISNYEIAPGEYYLKSTATKGCTGTVRITVE